MTLLMPFRLTTPLEEAARQGDAFSTWTGLLAVLAILVIVGLYGHGRP